jgi:hypothetical protein
MSTRSMVVVAQRYDGDGGKGIPLYRHSDGYLAEAGAAIVETLKDNPPDCEAVLARLLALRYEYDGEDHGPIYRAATWRPEGQSDLEHVYAINYFTVGGARCGVRNAATVWRIKHFHREGWTEKGAGGGDYREWPVTEYTVEGFAAAVNAERREINVRMDERKATCSRYPMLEVPGIEPATVAQ